MSRFFNSVALGLRLGIPMELVDDTVMMIRRREKDAGFELLGYDERGDGSD